MLDDLPPPPSRKTGAPLDLPPLHGTPGSPLDALPEPPLKTAVEHTDDSIALPPCPIAGPQPSSETQDPPRLLAGQNTSAPAHRTSVPVYAPHLPLREEKGKPASPSEENADETPIQPPPARRTEATVPKNTHIPAAPKHRTEPQLKSEPPDIPSWQTSPASAHSSSGIKTTLAILLPLLLIGGGAATWYFTQQPAPHASAPDTAPPAPESEKHPLPAHTPQPLPRITPELTLAGESAKPNPVPVETAEQIEKRHRQRAIERSLEQGLALSGQSPESGAPTDLAKAIACFQEAATLGSAEADYQLGCIYIGQKDSDPDLDKARTHFLRAGTAGHAQAQAILYEMSEKGIGTGKDHTEAVRWLQLAARQLPAAQLKLAEQYYRGVPPLPQDTAKAVELINLALREDSQPEYRVFLARIYFGSSDKLEHELVRNLILQDAENGDPNAQTLMADIYQERKGMPPGTTEPERYRQIEHWLELLTEKGDPHAAYRLGIHYERRSLQTTGRQQTEYRELSRKNLQTATDLGHKDAAARLKTLPAAQTAATISAPASLAGATIRFTSSDENAQPMLIEMQTDTEGRLDRAHSLSIIEYKPNGSKAEFGFAYTDEHNANKLYNYQLIGRNVDEQHPYPDPETENEPLAIITFTHRNGNTYTGTLSGYLACDRFSYTTRFDNSPVTITFP